MKFIKNKLDPAIRTLDLDVKKATILHELISQFKEQQEYELHMVSNWNKPTPVELRLEIQEDLALANELKHDLQEILECLI